jgi:hypothetical protein
MFTFVWFYQDHERDSVVAIDLAGRRPRQRISLAKKDRNGDVNGHLGPRRS